MTAWKFVCAGLALYSGSLSGAALVLVMFGLGALFLD